MTYMYTSTGDDGRRLDLGIRGAWQPQADAPSHRNRSRSLVVWNYNRTNEKKRIYEQPVVIKIGPVVCVYEIIIASCFTISFNLT